MKVQGVARVYDIHVTSRVGQSLADRVLNPKSKRVQLVGSSQSLAKFPTSKRPHLTVAASSPGYRDLLI